MRTEAVVGWMPFSDDRRVASGRLRCREPLAALRREGFPVELYRPEREGRYRAVLLQKRFDGECQALARRLQARGARVALDLCDNYLYVPDGEPDLASRAEDVRRMIDLADAVSVSTEALAELTPGPTTVVRDGIEPCPPLRRLGRRGGRERLELIWFGTWGHARLPFGMCDLAMLHGELAGLADARLTVVSNSRAAYERWAEPLPLPTRYVRWRSHGQLCGLLRRSDACLIPVQPNPFSVCKSPNRLTLALSLGVPVVASGIPSYREFEAFCTLDDWSGGLRSAEARDGRAWTLAQAGRAYVREHHSLARSAGEWRRFLEGLLDGRPTVVCERHAIGTL